jgi:hypothetical protein
MTSSSATAKAARRMQDFIEEHIDEPITLHDLARSAPPGFSSSRWAIAATSKGGRFVLSLLNSSSGRERAHASTS